jgi:hypothetical protein
MQQPADDQPTSPGRHPAEGPEMRLPGADQDDRIDRQPPDGPNPDGTPGRDQDPPDDPSADLPERLGRRIENGPSAGMTTGGSDLVPDVQVPEETM